MERFAAAIELEDSKRSHSRIAAFRSRRSLRPCDGHVDVRQVGGDVLGPQNSRAARDASGRVR